MGLFCGSLGVMRLDIAICGVFGFVDFDGGGRFLGWLVGVCVT
jgi:hypothetical protein